jgi:leader peptidase (prepilin peptidase)/N-methyltransferase
MKYALNGTTAALFALAIWRLGFSPELPGVLAFIFGGVLLSVIDWRVHRLPTRLVYYTLAGVGAGLLFASLVEWNWVPLATAILGALLLASAFGAVYLVMPRVVGFQVIGFGDVRLAFVLGALLGWYGLPYVLYGALLGHLLAALMGIVLLIKRRTMMTKLAFGPPLMIGTLAVVLFHV